jgi:hypothetical protein
VTPDQPLRLKQHAQLIGNHNTATLLGNDGNPSSHQHGNTHISIAAQSPLRQQCASPTKTANIRVRRSDYGTTLLQSPARAGYASRMRQMFTEAGGNHASQVTGNELYPQLANVSRKASPPLIRSPTQIMVPRATIGGSTGHCVESLRLSAVLPTALLSRDEAQPAVHDLSEHSSGSWSNDSGYLVTQLRSRDFSFTVPPNERIHTWLLDVPNEARDLASEDNVEANVSLEQSAEGISLVLGTMYRDEDGLFSDPCELDTCQTQGPGLQATRNDTFMCSSEARYPPAPSRQNRQRAGAVATDSDELTRSNAFEVGRRFALDHNAHIHTPTMQQNPHTPHHSEHDSSMQSHTTQSQILEEGGIQLSPLSPNVCVERGPSRYHSPRKPRDTNRIATPGKAQASSHFHSPGVKENIVLGQQGAACIANPVAPRSNRLGTRFRRPP